MGFAVRSKGFATLLVSILVFLSANEALSAPQMASSPQSAVKSNPLNAGQSVAEAQGKEQIAWRIAMSQDLDFLEGKAEQFLADGFALYDKLITCKEAPTAAERRYINDRINEGVQHYRELFSALERVRERLVQANMRQKLGRMGLDGDEQLQIMQEIFTRFKAPALKHPAYLSSEQASAAALMFGDRRGPSEMAALGLPATQQDALIVLEHLRRISRDLADVNSLLSDWIYDPNMDVGDLMLSAQ